MGRRGFNKEWAQQMGMEWQHHPGGHGPWGAADEPGRPGRHGGPGGRRGGPGGPWGGPGRSTPPPWLAGLFGPGPGEGRRGPRARRGDVRAAIIAVLAEASQREEQLNGYQVIGQIAERSGDAWRPSPGSVYPTIQQLQDEGLVEADDERGRRTLRLTQEGAAYVEANPAELAAVWAPFEEAPAAEGDRVDLKPEIGQVMGAVWQIVTTGSEQQRKAATEVLVEARRKLYGILADGDEVAEEE